MSRRAPITYRRSRWLVLTATIPFLSASLGAQDAQRPRRGAADTLQLPGVSVVGTPDRLARIPGSVDRVDAAQLKASRVFSTNEALRKVAGLVVRDEEHDFA